MPAIWIILVILAVCFGGVLIFGAPYLPTLKKQIDLALDLASLKPGQMLIELGSGDGRVALAAARRGHKVVGYELNPLLVIVSKLITWRYRKLVEIRWRNFLTAKWPKADAIFVFSLDKLMPKIDRKITAEVKRPVKLISYAFKIPGKQVTKASGGLFVYDYH